jgi:hypothetical protein
MFNHFRDFSGRTKIRIFARATEHKKPAEKVLYFLQALFGTNQAVERKVDL